MTIPFGDIDISQYITLNNIFTYMLNRVGYKKTLKFFKSIAKKKKLYVLNPATKRMIAIKRMIYSTEPKIFSDSANDNKDILDTISIKLRYKSRDIIPAIHQLYTYTKTVVFYYSYMRDIFNDGEWYSYEPPLLYVDENDSTLFEEILAKIIKNDTDVISEIMCLLAFAEREKYFNDI